jgi:hypothetical protein
VGIARRLWAGSLSQPLVGDNATGTLICNRPQSASCVKDARPPCFRSWRASFRATDAAKGPPQEPRRFQNQARALVRGSLVLVLGQ